MPIFYFSLSLSLALLLDCDKYPNRYLFIINVSIAQTSLNTYVKDPNVHLNKG